jgi:hypothetical protein
VKGDSVPRKKVTEAEERPKYLTADGKLDFDKIFKFQPKQTELLRNVVRNGKMYIQPAAQQCLSVGGIRSGKTSGWLLFLVMHYCLQFSGCNILVLRRTFKELEAGAISDFRTFIPKELYDYDATRHVAVFKNGSKVIFGHCNNLKERDIEQYLGQAYCGILVDECGQFSADAWLMLFSRNIINAGCQRDEAGNLPFPVIIGCSNPLGPHYEFYRTVFTQKEPWMKPEDARKDETNGTWWVIEGGEWRLIYDPSKYACQRSTVLDNQELLKRDPGIIARLMSMPKAKRDKMLLGLDGTVDGQYFDVFDPYYHVINLRDDPDAIIWQDFQPVWIGQDWGVVHANAAFFFTKALVKTSIGDDYKLKTVCFAEAVVTGGKTMQQLVSILSSKCKLPNGTPFKPKNIYFSHEKFARQMEAHSPADEYSRALREVGMPSVTPATRDRIGSASLMYNMFKKGDLVILDSCKEIILAIPSLMRNPDEMDDVLKVDAKGDDVYDGFRYGLYGYLAARKKPVSDVQRDRLKELLTADPLAAHFYALKIKEDAKARTVCFTQKEQPVWVGKSKA